MEAMGTYEEELRACGYDAGAVQRVMTRYGLLLQSQGQEWVRLARASTDPVWADECVARAGRIADTLCKVDELDGRLGCAGMTQAKTAVRKPVEGLAVRHFQWVGKLGGELVQSVRIGITNLAQKSFIYNDIEQQAALRRGLGIALNETERTSRAPWVYWLGSVDTLHYLVDSLWEMERIYCSGGPRDKWKTLCGFVADADGNAYDSDKFRGYACRSEKKRLVIDEAILNGLRIVRQ